MRAFISHIAEEASLALVLKKWIEIAFLGQVEVFVSSDGDDISGGDQWFLQIEDALADARILLVICSPVSVDKPWINFESGAGWIKKVPVMPICHSGMTKGKLPNPISFFQAHDVEASGFSEQLMKDLSKQLGFESVPYIPYQEMTDQINSALSNMREQPGHTDQETEMGYFDHSVAMQDGTTTLGNILQTIGEDANIFAGTTETFTMKIMNAQANQSKDTQRYLRKIARQFGKKLEVYAERLSNSTREYQRVLPETSESLQYVIEFKIPETDEDWEALEALLLTFNSFEETILNLKNTIDAGCQVLVEIPNYQTHMNRGIQKVIEQYDALIASMDATLAMIQKARTSANSMKYQRAR